jgi:glyoxylase-like metal-dependent hydrolase (beta-lactamase superfamily II)
MNSPGDFTSLLTDVTERLFNPLPDATWVYPGHGNDTTLGRSARTSPSGATAAGEARRRYRRPAAER